MGVRLVGGIESAKVFQTRPKEELIEGAGPSWLAGLARTTRKASILKAKETKTDDVFKQVYEMTTDTEDGEAAKGWAEGPYTEEEVSNILGDGLQLFVVK